MAAKTQTQKESPKKKKRWLLKLMLLLVVLLTVVVVFAQTGIAMRSIYLPIASKALATEITASSGRVGLGGKVKLDDLKVMGNDGQPALSAAGIDISVSPLSFLSGEPTINHVRIDQPSLRVQIAQNGTTNLPQPPASDKSKDTTPPITEKSEPITELPAFNIGEIDIKNLTVNYADADGNSIKIDPLSINFKGFKPGASAPLNIALTAHIDKPDQGIKQTVNLKVDGTLSEADDRKSVSWDQKLSVESKGTLPSLIGEQTMLVNSTAMGNFDLNGTLKNLLKLTAEAGGTKAADVTADIDWNMQSGSPTVNVNIENVTKDFLNLVMAPFSPVSLASGKIDASITGSGTNDVFGYTVAFNAVDMRALMNNQRSESIAVNLNHKGNVTLNDKLLTLDTLKLDLQQAAQPFVTVNLDKPMKLMLDNAQAASSNLANEHAVLNIAIANTSIETLKPWLAFSGNDMELPITAGVFGGNTTVDVANLGKAVKVDGKFFVRDLAIAALNNRKLSAEKNYSLEFTDMNNLVIRSSQVDLNTGGQLSAQIKASGNFDVAGKSGSFHYDTNIPRLIAMANDLGLLPSELPVGLKGGAITASHDIAVDLNATKFDVKGQLGLKGLSIAKDNNDPLTLGLNLKQDITADLGRKMLDVRNINLDVLTSPEATQSGTVTLAGKMPLEAPGIATNEAGELKLIVDKLQLAPYIRMANALPKDATPQAVLNASENITRSKAGLFNLVSDVNLSLPPTPKAAQSTDPLDKETLIVSLKNQITQLESLALEYSIDAISKFGDKQQDSFSGKGTAKLSDVPEIAFTGTLDSLVADPYLSRIKSLQGDEKKPEATTTQPPAQEPSSEDEKAPPALVAKADLTINQFKFRTTDFVDAHMTANFDHGTFSYKLDKGTINGGSAFIDFNLKDDPIAALMNMAVKLDGVDLSRLAGMASPALAKRFSGLAHVDLSAGGSGKGKALMDSINGNIDLKFSDGHIQGVKLLDFIAKRTGIESFMDVRFNSFGGKVGIENGWATLDSVKLLGPNHWFGFKGKVSTSGKLDLAVSPGLSSSFAQSIGTKNPLMAAVSKLESGYVRLPLSVNVKGEPGKYSITPGVNDMGITSAVTETVKEQVIDRVMNSDKTTSQVLNGVGKGLGEIGKLGGEVGKIGGDAAKGLTEGLGGLLGGSRKPANKPADSVTTGTR